MLAMTLMTAVLAATHPADAPVAEPVPVAPEVLAAASAALSDHALSLDGEAYLLAMGATAGVDALATGAVLGGGALGFMGLLFTVGDDDPVRVTAATRAVGVPLLLVGGAVALTGGVLAVLGAPLTASYLLPGSREPFGERMSRALPGLLAGGVVHLAALGLLAFAATAPVSGGFYPLLGAAAAVEVVGMPLAAWAANATSAPAVPVVAAAF